MFGAWAGFANPVFQFPLAALGLPLGLAWIGFRATSARKAFRFGWLAGTLAATGCLYWMVIPVSQYGNFPFLLALPCPMLVGAVLGMYYGAFSAFMHVAGKHVSGAILCLLAGLVWAALEILCGTLFTGFPWMNLASAFTPWPAAIQLASIVGAYGLSGIFVVLAVSLLLCSTYRSSLALAVFMAILVAGFGLFRLQQPLPDGPEIDIALIQGNVDQSRKWDGRFQVDTVEKYIGLTRKAEQEAAPELAIWPETAMPFYLQERTRLSEVVRKFVRESSVAVLTGTPAYEMTNPQTRDYVLFNRAALVSRDGRIREYYDKEHLVPFGEYMPFEEWLPFGKLVQAAGDFVPGKTSAPLSVGKAALGTLICYEAIFPELAQKQVAQGATVLVNISNDAWFGRTSAPMQHLSLATLRAVEQGRWLARSTNTGISAAIDPHGRITARSGMFTEEFLNIRVKAIDEKTIFHHTCPTLAWGIPLAALLGVAFVVRREHIARKR